MREDFVPYLALAYWFLNLGYKPYTLQSTYVDLWVPPCDLC